MFVSASEGSKLDRSQHYHSPTDIGNAFFRSGLCSRPSWIICGLNIRRRPISISPGLSGEISGDERAQTPKGAALKLDGVPGFIVLVGVPSTKIPSGAAVSNSRLHPPQEILQGLGGLRKPIHAIAKLPISPGAHWVPEGKGSPR